ncbi:MAG: NAD(P)-dependent oxidoreductase [Betaproteobacteria bacterium]|nr:NAD(P)-dependent oxidoreductase [Betaproteobacteria bacterium]
MKVGIAGTGKMGQAVAQRLMGVGHEVMVWNRNAARADALVAAGATRVERPADLARQCDVVISLLTDAAAIDAVHAGAHGLFSVPGALLLEMSTVAPEFQAQMGQRAQQAGVRYVECPVGGSVGPAKEGKLIGFAAGSADDVQAVMPLLEQMCKKVVAVGAHGNGARMKLAVNLPLMVYWQTLGEALSLVQSLDIDPKLMIDVLSESSGGPNMLKVRGGMIADALAGTPQAAVTVDIATMRKDVRTMVEQGAKNGFAMPLAEATLANLERAIDQGLAGADCSQFPVWWLAQRAH